jgi:hypothetical protein
MALSGGEKWESGFVRAPDGSIVTTVDGLNAMFQGGLLRDADGRLVIDGSFVTGKPGQKYRTLLGSIRNIGSPNYWQLISDSAHIPSGIASVVSTDTDITINYDFEASAIGSVIAVPDETMASQGWTVGASVSKTACVLKLGRTRTISGYVSHDGTSWSTVGDISNPVFSAGVLTVDHSKVIGTNTNVAVSGRGSIRAGITTGGNPATETQTKIEFYDNAGAVITTAGATLKAFVSRFDRPATLNHRTFIDTTTDPLHNIWLFGIHEI